LIDENEDAAKMLGGWISDGTYHLGPLSDEVRDAELLEDISLRASGKLCQMFEDPQRNLVASEIHANVRGIFALALELHRMMLCSRAFFSFQWVKPKFEAGGRSTFDPGTMECLASGKEPKRVIWTLTPILWKHGNADGQHYDQKAVLAKARVICE
jgi:hypothetical protein